MAEAATATFRKELITAGRRGAASAEFWRRAEAGELAFQRCPACRFVRYPPAQSCPSCGLIAGTWEEAEEPTLAAWTVTHAAAADRLPTRLQAQTPYALALVRFAQIEDFLLPIRLHTDDLAGLTIGLKVSLDVDAARHAIVGTAETP